MTSRHLSIRINDEIFQRLEEKSRQAGQSRSQLAKTLLEEGLRMAAHSGIVFRGGPAGRRPALAGGPDVWEVMRVFHEIPARGHERTRQTAELVGLTSAQVRTAVRYYTEYLEEIDDWIQHVDDAATRAEAAWQSEQDLLQR